MLVAFLAVPAGADDGHDDIFGRHEWKFLANVFGNDARVDDEALGYVLEGGEDDVCREEGFWDRYSAVGAMLTNSQIASSVGVRNGSHLSSRVRSNHCTELVISEF